MAKSTPSAISAVVPIRLVGLRALIAANYFCFLCSQRASQARVYMTPREVALRRMRATSEAKERARTSEDHW